MKIEQMEHDIAESLANVPTLDLPSELQGLRHLPLGDHSPRVTIRQANGRKIRPDADASSFDSRCRIQIEFQPTKPSSEGKGPDTDSEAPRVRFRPVPIRGGSIAATVLDDRR